MDLDELQIDSWKTAEEHGFHQAQVDLPPETLALYLRLLLTIGELSEAAEELRAGHLPGKIYYEYSDPRLPDTSDTPVYYLYGKRENPITTKLPGTVEPEVIYGKPAGFPIEMADALIRLADLCESAGFRVSEAVEEKAAYNKTREHMHGKTA